MAFAFSDRHIEDYHIRGYTVFRQILPPSLIADLRLAADRARELAREERGPQAQRLQPLRSYDIDQQPFINYAELPELVDALRQVLTPRHFHGDRGFMGILLEPAESSWCTAWHRDWRDNIPGLDLTRWESSFSDINLFNQVNCALYEDCSTWFVPGSHLRRDLPGEVDRFPDRPIPRPDFDGMEEAAREHAGLDYCRSMPGAVQTQLEAGDYCLYRNTLWHLGNYVPYRKRATIHDGVFTPEFVTWMTEVREEAQRRRQQGHGMENPNQAAVG